MNPKTKLNPLTKFLIRLVSPSNTFKTLNRGFNLQKDATYDSDGMLTRHNVDCLKDPKFIDSFTVALQGIPPELLSMYSSIQWRAHVCCWAANQAKHLDGDFVECGVWWGVLSRALLEYVDFGKLDKQMYLLDAWGNLELPDHNLYVPDIYDAVKARFSNFQNVHMIRGLVPDTLAKVPSEKIAYLSIDMNMVEPERAALEYFYPKMVSGGVIYFDDYGWEGHYPQKKMVDAFFKDKPESIMCIPSGQGIIVKI